MRRYMATSDVWNLAHALICSPPIPKAAKGLDAASASAAPQGGFPVKWNPDIDVNLLDVIPAKVEFSTPQHRGYWVARFRGR
jgi:hypothetical protein